jgi:hypothetical protein
VSISCSKFGNIIAHAQKYKVHIVLYIFIRYNNLRYNVYLKEDGNMEKEKLPEGIVGFDQ